MEIQIRRATYSEAKALKDFDPFIGDRRIDNWRGELFVALVDSSTAGFISFSSNLFYDRPFIRSICVSERFKRNGVGTALLKQVLEIYSGIEIWTSTELDNKAAQKLFEGCGFQLRGAIKGLDGGGTEEVFYCNTNIPS